MPNRNDKAFVALGSNLGESAQVLLDVMGVIESSGRGPLLRSSLWRSAPVDCPADSPDFINAVVAFKPSANETPRSLLHYLKDLELRLGRQANQPVNAPRLIDLDIICFANESVNDADLVVPHPRASERLFVLAPLAEIVPDFVFPHSGRAIGELIRSLQGQQICTVEP